MLLPLLSTSAQARSGYKIFPIAEATVPVTIQPTSADLECTDVDFWGQSVLTVAFPAVTVPGTLVPVSSVSALFDGACDQSRSQILDAAKAPIHVNLHVRAQRYIQWGIVSEGSDSERPYCQASSDQFAYFQDHALFPVYEYQTKQQTEREDLDYQTCVDLYGDGD